MRLFVALVVAILISGCLDKPEIRLIPVTTGDSTVVARLETRFYLPPGNGPHPLAVLLHGSSGGNPAFTDPWTNEVGFLVKHGFAVAAPMRRGRGNSTGTSAEHETKNCAPGAWDQGIGEALQDIDAVIDHAASLPGIDARNLTLWGVSRGGFLAVTYAARGSHRGDVSQVINFVGGWVAQAEDQCPRDFNLDSFRALGGPAASVPMVWLYGANDAFYGASAPGSYAATFLAAGGTAEMHVIPGIPENGHWLPAHPDKWQPLITRFLTKGHHARHLRPERKPL